MLQESESFRKKEQLLRRSFSRKEYRAVVHSITELERIIKDRREEQVFLKKEITRLRVHESALKSSLRSHLGKCICDLDRMSQRPATGSCQNNISRERYMFNPGLKVGKHN